MQYNDSLLNTYHVMIWYDGSGFRPLLRSCYVHCKVIFCP